MNDSSDVSGIEVSGAEVDSSDKNSRNISRKLGLSSRNNLSSDRRTAGRSVGGRSHRSNDTRGTKSSMPQNKEKLLETMVLQ